MSAAKEDTLRQFCDVTGADEDRSRFFLDSSDWQLDVALSSFYEHGGNTEEAPAPTAQPNIPILSDSDMDSPPTSPKRPPKKDQPRSNAKFATLDSLQKQESSSDEEEDGGCKAARMDTRRNIVDESLIISSSNTDDTLLINICNCSKRKEMKKQKEDALNTEIKELESQIERLKNDNSELRKKLARLERENEERKGQAFYAGGSERSGQQIIGPGKNRKDIVTDMFKSVRERGAVVFEDEPAGASSRGRGAFSGTGYRLGQTSDDHEEISSNPQPPQGARPGEPRSVRLRLYREGFTVDGGALRQYTNPENAEFLGCIRRGEIPPELSHGGEVRVALEDRRLEDVPTAQGQQAFSGKGHMLGSPTPPTVGATAPVAADVADRAANQRVAQDNVKLDDTKPVTTIQFRLADGSRITGRFNHTHTVSDLQQFVATAEPAYQMTPFVLLTTYPSTELTDCTVTLANGKLLNTTLLQRVK